MDYSGAFGPWLKQHRSSRGLSQTGFGSLIGCSRDTVFSLEHDRLRPSEALAQRIAATLRIPETAQAEFVRWARSANKPVPKSTPTSLFSDSETLPDPSWPASNLPQRLRSMFGELIGRDDILDELDLLLTDTKTRLVTLHGPPGAGKTRLALEIARRLEARYAHSIFFVDLAPIRDPDQIIPTIAQVLGMSYETRLVVETIASEDKKSGGEIRSLTDRLVSRLQDKQLLLLLDNFEQLVTGAPLLRDLIEGAPRLQLLVTSRQLLHLPNETPFMVPPLNLPDERHLAAPTQLKHTEAVALFISRGREADHSFELTASNASALVEMCLRLDGLPLAIELAAAHLAWFDPEALLRHMAKRLPLLKTRHRPAHPRQQTMRAAIDWSYELLAPEDEQPLFRCVSVFQGGFTLEAAEVICAAQDGPGVAVLLGLEALADKSLLGQEKVDGERRFVMLQTIQEYAQDQLAESGSMPALRQRHADYYLQLAEEAAHYWTGPAQLEWLARLAREHPNLRAALTWCQTAADGAEMELRLTGALFWFWFLHSHFPEGRTAVEHVLSHPDNMAHPAARALALWGAGILASEQADHTTAHERLEASVALYQELGDLRGRARALAWLGEVERVYGDLTAARAHLEESLALAPPTLDPWGHALAQTYLGAILYDQGDREAARPLFEASVAALHAVGDKWALGIAVTSLANTFYWDYNWPRARQLYEEGVAALREMGARGSYCWPLNPLGHIAMWQRDYPRAVRLYTEAAPIHREMGNWRSLWYALNGLGEAYRAQGRYAEAARYYQEGWEVLQTFDAQLETAWLWANLGFTTYHLGDTQQAMTNFARALPLFQELDDRGIVMCLAGLASLAASTDHPSEGIERAACLFGAAEALRAKLARPLFPADQIEYDEILTTTRAKSDAATWRTGEERGGAMSRTETIAEALAVIKL